MSEAQSQSFLLEFTGLSIPFQDVPADDQPAPESPFGTVPEPFSFALSKVPATQFSGGTAKIVDSTTFKVSVTIAAAEVTVEPGAMRCGTPRI